MTNHDVHLDMIDHVQVASPCPVKWNDLEGDGATRHCGQCNLNVHNLSLMTRAEVQTLVNESTGRVCGAFYRRADGTLLTQDCPVGIRAVRIKTAKMLSRVAAAIGVLLAGGVVLGRDSGSGEAPRLRRVQPFAALSNLIDPSPAPPIGPMVAGEIFIPTPGPNGGAPGAPGAAPAPCGTESNPSETGT